MKNVLLTLLYLFTGQLCYGQIRTITGRKLDNAVFETRVKKAMDALQVQGMSVAIINNGKIVYNKGFGTRDIQTKCKVEPSTCFEAASLSKPVFAFFVLKLVKNGQLDLDKPLFNYLAAENITDERYKRITARMVLSHTTGLPNWSESRKMSLLYDPGKGFSYSGEAYVYLSKVIAKLCNVSLNDLDKVFQVQVARALNLDFFRFTLTNHIESSLANGYQKGKFVRDERNRDLFDAAGGLYANSGNYAKFLVWLMNHRQAYSEMFRPVVTLEKNNIISAHFGVNAWTLGMAVIKTAGLVNFWHGGNNLGYTSSFMINPDKKFGYVYFTNEDQCNGMKKVFENILWR